MTLEHDRVPLGRIHAHRLRFDEAIDAIVALARAGAGGTVLTPNVDHVVLAEHDDTLVAAYAGASLSLVDGKPLVWLGRMLGRPFPDKISGSDLVEPLAARAAKDGLSLFLLGAKEGVGARAASALSARYPTLRVAGVLAPPHGFDADTEHDRAVVERVSAARPDIVLVALGAPRQERWMEAHRHALAPAVLLGVGATLDFLAGERVRAPRLVSELGLEWAFRLAQEPRRMAARYLVRDRAFFGIALRTLREHRRR